MQEHNLLSTPQITHDRQAKLSYSWLNARISTEQLKLLHQGSLRMIIILGISLSGVILLLWNSINTSLVLPIATWLATLGLLRQALASGFLREAQDTKQDGHQKWLLYFCMSTALSGASFAAAILLLMPFSTFTDLAATQLLLTIALLSSAVLFSCYLPAFICFSLPSLLPVSLSLWMNPVPQTDIWAFIQVILLGVVLYCALYAHRFSIKSLERRFRNQALSDLLSDENRKVRDTQKELEETHAGLEQMVTERTRELSETTEALKNSEHRLSQALDASRLGFWDWDMENEQIYHSHFKELFGYDTEKLSGFKGHLEPLIHTSDAPRVRKAIIAHLRHKTDQYLARYRILHANGSWVWVEDSGQVVEWNDKGRASRMLGTRRDISLEMEHERQTRLALTLFQSTSEAIFVLNARFRFVAINKAFKELTGYSNDEIINKTIADFQTDDGNEELYNKIGSALIEQGRYEGELIERRKDGDTYPIWIQISSVRDQSGRITHYVGLFRDLTEYKQTEERLTYLANFDPLTGLANRNRFRERLYEAIAYADAKQQSFALITIDLDRFKQINDSLGHEVGDNLLQQVSRRLTQHTSHAHSVARLAADEFSLIIDNNPTQDAISALGETIVQAVSKPYRIHDHELIIGASIGVAMFPENARELQTLISQADMAMAQAKYLGGNNLQFYNRNLQSASRERVALETSLRKAISNGELETYYQPKMTLAGDTITKAEALVRWNHPEEGLITPGRFISIAEESSLINDIGEFVMRQACQQARTWLDQGWEIRVSVNLSVSQLRQAQLIELIRTVLEETRLPPHLLELELTESLIMDDIERTIEALHAIRQLGVTISIDDFGTGYSSLSYLKRFPVDALKIDRSFISSLDTSEDDSAITRAIIVMAHSLDLKVVAEGVEKPSHLQFLRDNACDEVQGYFISKPLPAAEFSQFLASRA